MRNITINNVTYFLREDQIVDISLIYREGYYPSRMGFRLSCLDGNIPYNLQEPMKIEKLRELWTIDGIEVKTDVERTLRTLYDKVSIPFAINHRYMDSYNMYHFAFPYWYYEEDPDKIQFKMITNKIIEELDNISGNQEITDIIKRFIDYERFSINHTGTLCELFKDYYDKYIKSNDVCQVAIHACYAICYYLFRLGYWYMDYVIKLDRDARLYINIDNEELYLDENISSDSYKILDNYFYIALPKHPSPDD